MLLKSIADVPPATIRCFLGDRPGQMGGDVSISYEIGMRPGATRTACMAGRSDGHLRQQTTAPEIGAKFLDLSVLSNWSA
jgi:hypothetical protein